MLRVRERWGGVVQVCRRDSIITICVIAMALVSFPVLAKEDRAEHTEAESEAGHHGKEGHNFKNAFALFLGATNESGHGTEPTWGLEYARALSPRRNIGGLIDYAGGEQRNAVIAPMVTFKPVGGLVFLAAPGVEYHNGRGQVEHHLLKADAAAVDEDETYFVLRLGVAYYFHVGSRYGIGPAVNVDSVNGHEVWVYGVNFEVMF
jgi:hypothetical protein